MDDLMDWVRKAKDRDEIRELICHSLMDLDLQTLEEGRIEAPAHCLTKNGRIFIDGKQTHGPGSAPRPYETFERVAYTHFAGPTLIDLDGDTARTESYAIAWVLEDRGDKRVLLIRSIRYLDQLVKEDGRWLIDERRHNLDWMFEAEPTFSITRNERAVRDW